MRMFWLTAAKSGKKAVVVYSAEATAAERAATATASSEPTSEIVADDEHQFD